MIVTGLIAAVIASTPADPQDRELTETEAALFEELSATLARAESAEAEADALRLELEAAKLAPREVVPSWVAPVVGCSVGLAGGSAAAHEEPTAPLWGALAGCAIGIVVEIVR